MALATRCPNCQVLFRVVADQLKLRGGLVRCGACRHVFDAIGSLTYIEDSAAAAPEVPNARRAAPPTLHATAVATPMLKSALDEGALAPTPAQPDAPKKPDWSGPPTLLAPPEEPGTGADKDRINQLARGARRSSRSDARVEGKADARPAVDSGEPPAEGKRAQGPGEAAGDGSEKDKLVVPPPGPKRRRRRPAQEEIQPRQDAEEDPAAVHAAEETGPAFLRETPAAQRHFSVVFGGGSALLAVLLVVQLAVIFRTEITTRWPQWRPTLVQLCGLFGCNVGWPTRAELLAVVGTELQAIPGTDVLELTAVVRNRASFKVALPAIEVTLTDTTNRTLARKVFAPVDYLASTGEPSSRIDDGLGPSSDLTIRVAFEARGITAVGFVVYPFYL
jgi:predicted Zn finger-like uncharacterized protein